MKRTMKMAVLLFIFLVASPAFSAQMRGYPYPVDEYVNDYAGVMNPQDAKAIHQKFRDLESRTGIEAVVVTINDFNDYITGDTSVETFAKSLFNVWGVGNKKENDGILIVVAVKARECYIKMGDGYDNKYDSVMKEIIEQKMIPHFKANNFSRGIYEGVSGVVGKLSTTWAVIWRYRWQITVAVLLILLLLSNRTTYTTSRWRHRHPTPSTARSSFGGGASGKW